MWTQEQKDIAWSYEGTCESIAVIARRLDLTEEQAEDLMLDTNLEQCGECGWWCECGELLDEANQPAPCMSCRGIH
ncbi:hypothetical protein [Xanthobacter aminoxidans]|uniref:Uncharacterized protein n=1 Tax=Xanthobacter aminoxidans TaxID=186280 RepID=A0ABW6ZQY8_9HYPH